MRYCVNIASTIISTVLHQRRDVQVAVFMQRFIDE